MMKNLQVCAGLKTDGDLQGAHLFDAGLTVHIWADFIQVRLGTFVHLWQVGDVVHEHK